MRSYEYKQTGKSVYSSYDALFASFHKCTQCPSRAKTDQFFLPLTFYDSTLNCVRSSPATTVLVSAAVLLFTKV